MKNQKKYTAKIITKESGEKLLTVKVLKRDFSMSGFPLFPIKPFPVYARCICINGRKEINHPKDRVNFQVIRTKDEWSSTRLQDIPIEGDFEAEDILSWIGRGEDFEIGIKDENKIYFLYLYDNKEDLFFGESDYETALGKLKDWKRYSKEHNTIDNIKIIPNDGRNR